MQHIKPQHYFIIISHVPFTTNHTLITMTYHKAYILLYRFSLTEREGPESVLAQRAITPKSPPLCPKTRAPQ